MDSRYRRYIVTITDNEGTVWLNTASFEVASKRYLIESIVRVIAKAKALTWCDALFVSEMLAREKGH